VTPAFAEEPPRLRPVSRGGRNESSTLLAHTPIVDTTTPAPAPTPSFGDRVTQLAREHVGSRYTWGGTNPLTGFDCSGLVRWVLGELGVEMGRTVWSQFPQGTPVEPEQLQPGDLVFFANTYTIGLSHVGIYVGDGQFVDAGTERTGVRQAHLWDAYWANRYVGARRIG
jgi:cell wall-associated NlpC family hydrolase